MKRKDNKRPKSTLAGLSAVMLIILQILLQQIQSIQTFVKKLTLMMHISPLILNILIVLVILALLTYFLLKKPKHKQLNLSNETPEKLTKPLEDILVQINKSGEFRIGKTEHNLKYTDEQIRAYLGAMVGKYVYSQERLMLTNESLFKTYKLRTEGYDYLVSRKLI
jgi:biopolymer transport protein ExbD